MVDLLLDRREMTATEVKAFLVKSKPQKLRTTLEFVKQELRLPKNPTGSNRFRESTQPAATLWLQSMALPFRRRALTGCTQSGKTWCGLTFPAMWHLFELQQTGVYGVPVEDMANAKWQADLLPMIEGSRYRELLPTSGEGSRRGKVRAEVRFQHGVALRFMSGRGGDAERSGFTAWWAVVTEVDKMDTAGEASREADPITQIEARGDSVRPWFRLYLECTVSFKSGRIWQEIQQGSNSRAAQRCVHCGDYVTLTREHLQGWKDADTVMQARREAFWVCPACGSVWSDEDRYKAAQASIMLHGDQTVQDGEVVGDMPDTDTLSYRWAAPDNLFWKAAEVAEREWRADRSEDEGRADRELCQFVWAVPPKDQAVRISDISVEGITHRMNGLNRGHLFDDTEYVTIGQDIGMFSCWWVALGFRREGGPHVIDYGLFEAPSREVGPERGIKNALYELSHMCDEGFGGVPAGSPTWCWIDSRYNGETVREFVREMTTASSGTRYMPTMGFGSNIFRGGGYVAPRVRSKTVPFIGDGYHIEWRKADGVYAVHINADYWKAKVHAALQCAPDDDDALTLYHVPKPKEHIRIAKHWLAEHQESEWVPGKNEIVRFVTDNANNHLFDATYMALAAGQYAAAVREAEQHQERGGVKPGRIQTPDGRAFVATQR